MNTWLMVSILAAAVGAVGGMLIFTAHSAKHVAIGNSPINASTTHSEEHVAIGNSPTNALITTLLSNSSNGMHIPDFNVAAVGDWACNNNSVATIRNIESKTPEVVLALGDLSYSSNFSCWLKETQKLDPLMHIVIGNHDGGTVDNPTAVSALPELMDHFQLMKQYYSFDYQNVHFTVISTELPYTVGTEQYKFVDHDLASANSNHSITWKVVMFHKPAYGSPSELTHLSTLRDTLHPLFDKYAVNFVLEGHFHNYQRSYPLKYNPLDPPSPTITTAEKTNYGSYSGEIWIIVGTGGATPHALTLQEPYIIDQYENKFGFLNLDFTENGSVVVAKFYSNDGQTLDSFKVQKLELK